MPKEKKLEREKKGDESFDLEYERPPEGIH